jgi:Predicted membrane protein
MIISNAEKIDNYFIEYVEKLDAKEISSLIEEKVGDDLQFVRINGTIVGGLIGLLIHSGTEFVSYFGAYITSN